MFKAELREFIREAGGKHIYTGQVGALKAEAETGSSGSSSDEFHLGIGVYRHHIVALWRLDASLGVALTVEPVVQKEVTALLKVQAAVAAHEALRVVKLVPSLDDGAPDGETGGEGCFRRLIDAFVSAPIRGLRASGGAKGVPESGWGKQGCVLTRCHGHSVCTRAVLAGHSAECPACWWWA